MKVGTDAFILGSWVKIDSGIRSILDVGTGSGVIALMLAQQSDAQVTAIDIDENSVSEAATNFANSLWSNRLKAIHTSVELFARTTNQIYDLIVCNPPFFQNSLLPIDERKKLTRHNVALTIDVFINTVSTLLSSNGKVAVILPVNTGNEFCKVATDAGLFLSDQLTVYSKPNKPAIRNVYTFSKVYSEIIVEETIVVKDEQGRYTHNYKLLTKDFHPEGYLN